MKVKVKICKSKWEMMKGLMFSRKKILIFDFNKEVRTSLHMFFVFFKINVYFLDSEKKVIEIKKNFLPFTFYFPKNSFHYIVESPQDLKLRINDKVNF